MQLPTFYNVMQIPNWSYRLGGACVLTARKIINSIISCCCCCCNANIVFCCGYSGLEYDLKTQKDEEDAAIKLSAISMHS